MMHSRISAISMFVTLALLIAVSSVPLCAQQATSANAIVPTLVQLSGVLTGPNGKPLTNIAGVTFSLYAEQNGGAPLWLETQNVEPNQAGQYSVMLGSASSQGLPASLFVSGQARWLEVEVQGQEPQPRVMLLSVPYAMKAGDAQTVGGLPPSAFVLAVPPSSGMSVLGNPPATAGAAASGSPLTTSDVTTTGGTASTFPLFTTATNIQNSILTQTGKTAINVLGKLNLPALGTAKASAGFNSRPQDFVASVFNSSSATAVPQTFQWQAEPSNNDQSTATGTLNLLYASGTATPAETGLKISSNGLFTFATGQTFPGTGTIAGVTAGTDLTGGGTRGTVTLNLDTTKVPQLATANTFTGNQAVNGNVSATGTVNSNSGFLIGNFLFASGSVANANAFLGFAGNTNRSNTGTFNTATGWQALKGNTSGALNTATGDFALLSNTTGGSNTAIGVNALDSNTTGYFNTAVGRDALYSNTVDSYSTAVGAYALFNFDDNTGAEENEAFGYQALYSNTTGNVNDAFGYQALYSNTTGNNNDAFGYQALYFNVGSGNNAFGGNALSQTTGSENTATGNQALYNNTTGSYNTASGSNTGGTFDASQITGSYDTLLGSETGMFTGSLNNATAIGACATVSASNALVLGTNLGACGNGLPTANTKVGIDTGNPTNILSVLQGGGHAIADGWDTYSSRRWKTNIHPLQNALSKVEQLRGVSYDLKDSGKHEIGVIAEEVGKVVPEVVSYEENGKDARGVDYSRLTALLIEATKEQQMLIQKQQHQLKAQQAQMKRQQTEIARLSLQVKAIETSLSSNAQTGSQVRTVKTQVSRVRQ